jgi:hypothetical protein
MRHSQSAKGLDPGWAGPQLSRGVSRPPLGSAIRVERPERPHREPRSSWPPTIDTNPPRIPKMPVRCKLRGRETVHTKPKTPSMAPCFVSFVADLRAAARSLFWTAPSGSLCKETCASRIPMLTGSRLRIFHMIMFFARRLSSLAILRRICQERRHAGSLRWMFTGERCRQSLECRRSGRGRVIASNRQRSTQTTTTAMLRYFAATLLGLCCFGTSAGWAVDCFPHCDYYNDYGPYVIGPTYYCNPRCSLQGNCSPFLACKQQSRGIHKSNPSTTAPCLPDAGKCTSNYQCCSGSCNWSEGAHAYFCGGAALFSKHPPRPIQ